MVGPERLYLASRLNLSEAQVYIMVESAKKLPPKDEIIIVSSNSNGNIGLFSIAPCKLPFLKGNKNYFAFWW